MVFEERRSYVISVTEHWSEPIFFKLLKWMMVPRWVFGRDLAFLQFEQQELANPKGDLVGIAFWAGRRRYLWNDQWWAEYPLESKLQIQRLNDKMIKASDEEFEILIKALEWVYDFQKSPPPESEYRERKEEVNWSLGTQQGQWVARLFLANKGPKVITRVIYSVK